MAINKNAYIRYQIIDNCLRNTGRNYHIDDLLEEVNEKLRDIDPDGEIRKRQLQYDIEFMESSEGFSAEIKRFRIGRRTYFRYADPKFSIRNVPVNTTESEYMKAAIQIMSRFAGTPQFEWVEELLPMLESKFGAVKDKRKIIAYESNLDYTGTKYIQPLFNAIHNERVLSVRYKPFNNEEFTAIFHPYFLKQYNNRWFVIGLNVDGGLEAGNFALDRILNIEETDLTYQRSNKDWEDYFDEIIGVTHYDKEPETIKLLFHEGAEYVKTKPLHLTQKLKEEDGKLEVRIEVIPNFELEKLILSFGNQVEVLEPESLRIKIADKLKEAMSRYL